MASKSWQYIAGICLLVGATAASALSLGRLRGTALLGRGLDLTVQASLEAQESTPEANCFSVDVFYGDTRVSPNSISLSPERLANGEFRVRIRSSVAVDEPVVTLYLRATCGAAVSRRFVLLSDTLTDADPVSAQPLSISPAIVPNLPAPSRAVSAAAIDSIASQSAAVVQADRNSAVSAQRQARREARQRAAQERVESRAQAASALPDVSAAPAQPRASIMRKADKAKASAPRLQVDLLDLTSAELSLRSSFEMSSAPSSDEAVRRQAQALWRTLNASPEDTLRDAQRLETLAGQMRTALDQSKRQSQDIAALSTELQAAHSARFLNPFTLFLGLLTLAAIALSVLLWRRNAGHSQPWWGNTASKATPPDEEHLWGHLVDAATPLQESAGAAKEKSLKASDTGGFQDSPTRSQATRPTNPEDDTRPGVLAGVGSQGPLRFVEKPAQVVDFAAPSEKFSLATTKITPIGTSAGSSRGGSMGRVDSTPPPSLMQSTKSSDSRRGFGHSDFAASGFSGLRVVAAEELFDIQEQADFFMSLDQPEQAIEVLKNHITDNVETSALAYMDLFDIYHRTGREADYAALREEFNRVFNAQVPEFARYGAKSTGLEGFPQVLSSIQAGWSRPQQALELIEESIFRQPGQDHAPLDMLAYRELMLLYALAKELARPRGGYSMLPAATQSGAMPMIPPLAAPPSVPDVDLGDGLMLSRPQIDMLSMDGDPTVSLPHSLNLLLEPLPDEGSGLDFDLGGIDQLDDIIMPSINKTP